MGAGLVVLGVAVCVSLVEQRCQLVRFTRKPYGFLRFARAYDAFFTDIYDFCRFKLTIIPRFIFELLSVCNDTRYAS